MPGNNVRRYVLHTFRPSETIAGVIRLLGRHNLSRPQLNTLLREFDEMNGRVVPKPGMTYKIPLPFEVTDDYGDVVPTPEPVFNDEDEKGPAAPGLTN